MPTGGLCTLIVVDGVFLYWSDTAHHVSNKIDIDVSGLLVPYYFLSIFLSEDCFTFFCLLLRVSGFKLSITTRHP
jgi:hypothetical protein